MYVAKRVGYVGSNPASSQAFQPGGERKGRNRRCTDPGIKACLSKVATSAERGDGAGGKPLHTSKSANIIELVSLQRLLVGRIIEVWYQLCNMESSGSRPFVAKKLAFKERQNSR